MSRLTWIPRTAPPEAFPPVDQALREPPGLLAAGGDLSESRLLYAYRHGIFPWYEGGQPILWWSPDPRTVLWPDALHVSRRLARTLRRPGHFSFSADRAFAEVMAGCAGPRRYGEGTWITPAMLRAYRALHEAGWAHSIEVWHRGELAGGVYGVHIGRVFFGESMFSRISDASKAALVTLVEHLRPRGLAILDCQMPSPHLRSLGATEIAREQFVRQLAGWCHPPGTPGPWQLDPSLEGAAAAPGAD